MSIVRDRSSVVVPIARWRAAFVTAFALISACKLWLAATLAPFTDEAFYWQESRHLAWGYSDLPPLTAWLIRFGETFAGHGLLGMRWPFLLLGGLLPWLVVAFARTAFDARRGWQAGVLCLALPLAGSLGVLALPDVPLTVAIMLANLALLRVVDDRRSRDWWMLGSALAVAWMTHYRAAMPMLVGLLFLAFFPRGRALWRRPGLWGALLLASVGLLPLLVSNWRQRGAGLAFQLVDRNPWQFHADALVQPLEQALTCTPLLYVLMLCALWACWQRRHRDGPWDLLFVVPAGFLGLYFLFGLFADDVRFRVHWPLPGYLPLLAVLPVLFWPAQAGARRRLWLGAALALAAAGQVLVLLYLGAAATPGGARGLTRAKAFPYAFVGWREVSAAVARAQVASPGAIVVADNFALAAELAFQFDGHPEVFSLDSPLNVKHGRAPQLAIWRRDEAALRSRYAGRPMLLAVEETAQRVHQRLIWQGTLCERIGHPKLLERLDLYQGRKRFALYRGEVPGGDVPGLGDSAARRDQCLIWQQAHAGEQARK